ncbi:MAG: hypothetical protein GY820_16055 [Gammaproteobacteria bacterium]|nr:hypothetical protein [Gammaproteobacteria bacterium]
MAKMAKNRDENGEKFFAIFTITAKIARKSMAKMTKMARKSMVRMARMAKMARKSMAKIAKIDGEKSFAIFVMAKIEKNN